MHPDVVAPFMFFLFLGAVILVPIWLRNRLYQQQLTVIAAALEKGVDPERIQLRIPMPENSGDINGNWKAGLMLIALGLMLALCFVVPMYLVGELDNEDIWPVLTGPALTMTLGAALMLFHYTIVGKVVRRGNRLSQPDSDLRPLAQ